MGKVERKVRCKGYTVLDEGSVVDRLALRGEVIKIDEEEAERGDALGYFDPIEDETEEEVVVPFEVEIVEMSDDEVDSWVAGEVTDKPPSVKAIIAAAEEDQESAERLLASEARVAAAQERDERVSLVSRLSSLIEIQE